LRDIVDITFAIIAIQVGFRPLRSHRELLNPIEESAVREAARERKEAERKAPRLFHDGLPLGNPNTDIRVVGASVAGPGAEPDSSAASVNTHMDARDFATGDRVLCWWWGLWWWARIHYVSVERNYVHIRWEWNRAVIKNYKPRMVRHP